MSREFKHYQLKRATKPIPGVGLASTVAVLNEQGHAGFCYIRFARSFVLAVGKKLPRGVSLDDPAYLLVCYNQKTQEWEVFARYLRGEDRVLLWKTTVKPSWLKFQMEPENGTGKTAGRAARSGRTASAKRSGAPTRRSGSRAAPQQAEARG